ncbi:MAG: hypothetical protein EXS39_01670 [Opitutaceae bacterium]|nr:hypothetical protein [Opitutaceae bacterium]
MMTAQKKKLRFLSPAGRTIRIVAIFLAAGSLAPAAEVVTHLFTSWYGVEAGNAVFKVNRANVDPEALNIIEQVKDYYKIELTDGESAPERVSVPSGVKVRAEVARKSAPWLIPDKPWEAGGVQLARVMHEDGLYRVWYSVEVGGRDKVIVSAANGRPKLGTDGTGFRGLCYMESRDAEHWVKPSLGLVEFRGSKDNNIISSDPRIWGSIFIDRAAPPEERYKSVFVNLLNTFDPKSKEKDPALGGAVSPDGIHWQAFSEPISAWTAARIVGGDGGPAVHRDEQTGKYVLYTRGNYPRRRSIVRAETSDFRHWPDAAIILTPGPDEDPSADYYDNPYLQYPGAPSAQLMLVSAFHRDTSQVDLHLASSMDGDGWNWLSPRTVVELGRQGDWDGGMLFACGDMVRLPDGRIAVGFSGCSSRHEEYWQAKFERGQLKRSQYSVAWALWEDGRIAGVEAEKAGEFTTLPLKATGQPIEVNARTGGSGSVQVDVLIDTPGRPYPKLALQAQQMTGDLSWRPLVFSEGGLTQLTGKTIRLRFHLFDAKVFGVRGVGLDWVSSYARK